MKKGGRWATRAWLMSSSSSPAASSMSRMVIGSDSVAGASKEIILHLGHCIAAAACQMIAAAVRQAAGVHLPRT